MSRKMLESAGNASAHHDAEQRGQPDVGPTQNHAPGHVLYVCTGCNFTKSLEEKAGRRGGNKLWQHLAEEVERCGGSMVHMEPVACLSVCKDSCVVALTAPDKYTYTFGWISPDENSARDIIAMTVAYAASSNGHVERADRPKSTRRLISKVPPPSFDPNVDDDQRNPRTAEQVPKPKRPQ